MKFSFCLLVLIQQQYSFFFLQSLLFVSFISIARTSSYCLPIAVKPLDFSSFVRNLIRCPEGTQMSHLCPETPSNDPRSSRFDLNGSWEDHFETCCRLCQCQKAHADSQKPHPAPVDPRFCQLWHAYSQPDLQNRQQQTQTQSKEPATGRCGCLVEEGRSSHCCLLLLWVMSWS